MRLIEKAIVHSPGYGGLVPFRDGVGNLIFSYDVELGELWADWEDPYGPPIATPHTLAEAREILTQAGHTIS